MGLAVVGIQIQVKGVSQAVNQLKLLKASIDGVTKSAQQLSKIKTPKKLTSNLIQAGPGANVNINSNNNITNSGNAAAKAAKEFTKWQKAMQMVAATAGTLSKAVVGLVNKIRQVGATVANTGRKMQSFGASLTMLGTRMTAFISLPIAAAFKSFVGGAATFEEEMMKVHTLAGLSIKDMEEMGDAVLKLAPEVGALPQELAEAAFFIASSDIKDVALAMDALTASAKGSAIGLGETKVVADAVTSILFTYGSASLDATKAVDLLTATTDRGKFETDEFAGSLKGVLGVAKAAGAGIEDVFALIATQTLPGFSPSEAASRVERILVEVEKAASSGKKLEALSRAGIVLDELKAAIADPSVGLVNALIQMKDQFDAAGVPLTDFFTRVQGFEGVLVTTGEFANTTLAILEDIKNAEGLTDAGFASVSELTVFMWERLKAAMSATGIVIGNVILPTVNALIQKLLPLVQGIADFAKMHPNIVRLAAGFGLVAAALGPLILFGGLLVSSFGAIIAGVGGLISVLGFLLGPVGLVLGAFVLLAVTITGLLVTSFDEIAEKSNKRMGDLGKSALGWGRNIMLSFAQGIANGATIVVQELIKIGMVIRKWLKGSSPPKLLPGLTDWGTNVVDSFLAGFTKADFSIFNTLSSTISSLFRSLSTKKFGGEEGVIPAILGSRAAINEALQQIKTVGTVSQETLRKISGSFGETSGRVREYALTLISLAEATNAVALAQEEVNRINDEFETSIKPLQDELDMMDERRREIANDQKREKIEKRLANPRISSLEREVALMELRSLEVRDQIGDKEAERDAALEIADASLVAAKAEEDRLKAQAELQKAFIDQLIETNELLKQQKELLERLKEAAEEAAATDSDAAPGDPFSFDPAAGAGSPFDVDPSGFFAGRPLTGLAEGMSDDQGGFLGEINGFIKEIQGMFDPLTEEGGFLDQLGDVWSDVFIDLGEQIGILNENISGFDISIGRVLLNVGGVLAGLRLLIWAGGIVAAVWGFLAPIFTGLAIILGIIGAPIVLIVAGITLLFLAIIKHAGGVDQALADLKLSFTAGWAIIKFFAVKGLLAIAEWGQGIVDKVKENGPKLWAIIKFNFFKALLAISKWGQGVSEKFTLWVFTWLLKISEWGQGIVDRFRKWGIKAGEKISTFLKDNATKIATWVLDRIAKFGEFKDGVIQAIKDLIADTPEKVATWLGDIVAKINTFVEETIPEFVQAGVDFVQGMIDGALSKLKVLKQAFRDLAMQAWESVVNFFDEDSPSKLAAKTGKNIVLGLVKGLSDNVGDLDSAIGRIFDSAVSNTFDSSVQQQMDHLQAAKHKAFVHSVAKQEAIAGTRPVSAPSTVSSNQFSFGPVNINSGMDEAVFEARVRQIVAQSIAG